ncbi:synapsin-1 [Heterocephalus glaber]|uniref:Synapsin-1 n=1 Tax=Heterocephalus glaber TaxID=10181 RepID=A0AAX6QM57_HETGA|nr:synapsin-1 [Heterocephalus glaber]
MRKRIKAFGALRGDPEDRAPLRTRARAAARTHIRRESDFRRSEGKPLGNLSASSFTHGRPEGEPGGPFHFPGLRVQARAAHYLARESRPLTGSAGGARPGQGSPGPSPRGARPRPPALLPPRRRSRPSPGRRARKVQSGRRGGVGAGSEGGGARAPGQGRQSVSPPGRPSPRARPPQQKTPTRPPPSDRGDEPRPPSCITWSQGVRRCCQPRVRGLGPGLPTPERQETGRETTKSSRRENAQLQPGSVRGSLLLPRQNLKAEPREPDPNRAAVSGAAEPARHVSSAAGPVAGPGGKRAPSLPPRAPARGAGPGRGVGG